jgi:hypothetical protein
MLDPGQNGGRLAAGQSSGRLGAALGVAIGGFITVWGSFLPWGTCPNTTCGTGDVGFFVLVERTGVGFGPGILTALLGFVLLIFCLSALRQGGASPMRTPSVMLALATLLTVGAFVLRMYVFPAFLLYGPEIGVYLVSGGAILAALSSWRVRRVAAPRRP